MSCLKGIFFTTVHSAVRQQSNSLRFMSTEYEFSKFIFVKVQDFYKC